MKDITRRELEFRYFDKEDGDMGEVTNIKLPNNTIPSPEDDLGIIAMQYIGMKDNKGFKIYEGDIIECQIVSEGSLLKTRGYIDYNSELLAFVITNSNGQTLLHHHKRHTLEILGNIYQNLDMAKDL